MLKYLKLTGVGPAPEMEMEFAPRLNVITGDNGLGKSFILDIAWWILSGAYSGYSPVTTAWNANIIYELSNNKRHSVSFSGSDRAGLSVRDHPPKNKWLVLYAKVDEIADKFYIFDFLRTPGITPASINPEKMWNGVRNDGKVYFPGLIDGWASWQKENGESFRTLCRVLETLSPSEDEKLIPGKLTRISLDDVRDIPSLKTPYGQEVPIVMASAAIKRIISLAYLLVWTWQEHRKAAEFLGLPEPKDTNIVFLIDEIECHLHPHWQRRIFRALLEVVKALSETDSVQVQIIATTHSPLILASLEPFFDEQQDGLFGLKLVRGETGQTPQVEIHKLPWRKRGEADNWLISEAFGNLLKTARSSEAEALLEKANAAMNAPNFNAAEAKRLDAELRKTLGDTDPFWMRWRFIGEKRGWLT